ncbi:MAG: hypothetical protein ACLFRH_08835, partial [Halothiobacillaceae bacterium]
TADLFIQENEEFTGQDTYGCIFSGQISQPESDKNLYEFDMIMSGCENNVPYEGLATLAPAGWQGVTETETLGVVVTNSDEARGFTFTQ